MIVSSVNLLIIVGITVVRYYKLNTHPSWSLFSTGSGYRLLTYNVSYSPFDPSLFQTNMTASISLTGIKCTLSTGDYYLDFKIGSIGRNWVTFTAQTKGANLFSLLTVDIIIFSQAFRGKFCIFFNFRCPSTNSSPFKFNTN